METLTLGGLFRIVIRERNLFLDHMFPGREYEVTIFGNVYTVNHCLKDNHSTYTMIIGNYEISFRHIDVTIIDLNNQNRTVTDYSSPLKRYISPAKSANKKMIFLFL